MLRKMVVAGVVLAGTSALVSQTKLGSYFRAAVTKMEQRVDESVSPELELVRIRNSVKDMDAEVEKAQGQLAAARVTAKSLAVEVDELKGQVEQMELATTKFGEMIKALTGTQTVEFRGRKLNAADATEVLAGEVGKVKSRKKELETKQKMQAIRARNRDILERQVAALRLKKDEVAADIAQLEADIQLTKLEQTESRYQNNGTSLADVKTSLKRLKEKVEIERETLKVARDYDAEATVKSTGKSVDQILSGMNDKTE